MPIYDVRCNTCNHVQEIYRSLAEYDDLPLCCGVKTERQVCAPMVIADIPAYQSTVTGEMIEGRRQHREHLKTHDLVEIGNEKIGNKPREVRGGFDLRDDLGRAVHKVLNNS